MAEKNEIKITQTYSLDPEIVAWISRKAALLTAENGGRPLVSASKIANDILRAAMEQDAEANEDSPTLNKKKTNPKIRAVRVVPVAA